MTNLLLLCLCIIPTLFILWYVYHEDKLDKEPALLLTILFISGIASAVMTVPITLILKINIPFLNSNIEELNFVELLFKFLISIALIEEILKWILTYLITWKNKNFNYIYDSIVYSTFVALGFATYENILYVFSNNSYGLMLVLSRGIISIPAHAVFGIYMGYYLGIAKSTKKKLSLRLKIKSLLIPIILHFTYDILLATKNYYAFAIFILLLYLLTFVKIKKISINRKKLN